MQKRIAKMAHYYAGGTRQVGEAYEVEDQHVDILLRAGRIEPVEGDPGYQGRSMESSQPTGYKTRDMKRQARKAA